MEDPPCYQGNEAPSWPDLEGKAAVVLVHFGDPATTLRCLDSLARSEGTPPAVVVADHGPGTPLNGFLGERTSSSTVLILRRENLGFGAGCNAAAAAAFRAGAGWVWFLNNDATLASPVLSQLLVLAGKHPQVGIWGTLQRDGGRRIGTDQLPDWYPTPLSATQALRDLPGGCHQLGPRETLSGASMLVSREAWNRLGPWPEWCFLYWEDVAWCLSAHELGIPMVMSELEIHHLRNTATGRHSPTTTYYGVRNSLLLHADRWPQRAGLRWRQAAHLLQKRFFQGNWRMLAPTLRGIRDARKGLRFRVS